MRNSPKQYAAHLAEQGIKIPPPPSVTGHPWASLQPSRRADEQADTERPPVTDVSRSDKLRMAAHYTAEASRYLARAADLIAAAGPEES